MPGDSTLFIGLPTASNGFPIDPRGSSVQLFQNFIARFCSNPPFQGPFIARSGSNPPFQKKISKVQDLLNNAEERSKEICVSSWMDDLRELSYDMENLVDEMNIERVRMEQELAIRNQAGTSHHVANIRYTYMDYIADYRPYMNNVKKWMNDVLGRLDGVLVDANDLELKPQVAGKSPVSSIASRVEAGVGASVDKSDVYGRQKDQEFVILELLSFSHSSKKNYSTISIVGMGGVGKTRNHCDFGVNKC